MAEKDATWPKYKRMSNSAACGCPMRVNFLESKCVSREEIDGRIRRYKWTANLSDLQRRRRERNQEVGRLRSPPRFLSMVIPK